ncbi:MAG: selenoneine synthase SenA [Gammaproteobacteria bacterium]|nr:selenoneine synthase SenA [Gammaproteobacteria bacterium]
MHAITKQDLIAQLRDARRRTLQLVDGLNHEQLMGPKNLATINPLPWEIGHTAYFHELWCLRHRHQLDSFLDDADSLYDSININHDDRWDLPIPPMKDIYDYMNTVINREIELLEAEDGSPEALYLYRYALFHEDMHTEAFTYTRQTLGHPAPSLDPAPRQATPAGPLEGDAHVPACEYLLGARPEDGFCFDNEKWAHPVTVDAFDIARAPVTNTQYLEFVEAGGYSNADYWDEDGWQWRNQRQLDHPVYWRSQGQQWQQRRFDQWHPLAEHQPVIHVSWHEANAWCRWAGRRLPTEAEWELAASGIDKNTYPWGEELPTDERANMDSNVLGCIDVAALPDSDSVYGCRQMLGNVWEWTDTTFRPFAEFTPDMYADYSQPLFNTTKVLRGGAWATRSRMIRNTWRNYYGPDRNDVFAGFRTCSL